MKIYDFFLILERKVCTSFIFSLLYTHTHAHFVLMMHVSYSDKVVVMSQARMTQKSPTGISQQSSQRI